VANHNDLAKAFIAGVKPKGACGAFTFDGDFAYSYSATIARKVAGVLLVNCMGFSTSTSAHRGKIRAAAKEAGLRIIEVPNLYLEHDDNLRHFRSVRRELERRLPRARMRFEVEDKIEHIGEEERAYRDLFLPAESKEAA